jgi:hypothetical protein
MCAEASWDQETLLAPVTTFDCIDIAAVPIVPNPTHSNLPPPLTSCFVSGFTIPAM